ncbi:MAG: TetR/AcrR family transcriptional regulator [Gammaproteobacteria bacterium]|jgi:AcrR family transcriptional regulator|nr:TetR/AcrR family transcriptional regulator [Gammaproteobacteria bacterium]MBT7369870.1 TetR/AcrR family transcriptional regulator [Gammaproteobacteria bacterium]
MSEPIRKRRTQEERKAESERQIIGAAIKIFARQGYLRTTLNEVGEEAGYTGGLVSHRFGSKAGLLKAVITNIGTRFINDQIGEALETDTAQEALCNYIAIYLKEVTVREGHLRALYVIMGEALGGAEDIRKDVAEFNERARDRIATIIKRGIGADEFRSDIDPRAAAVLIMGMLRGVVMQYLFDHKAFNTEKIVPLLQRTALGGLK